VGVREIRQTLDEIERLNGAESPDLLDRLRKDEKALRMFIVRSSKFTSAGDKQVVADMIDDMIEKVFRIVRSNDLHPREYITALSDFQSYVTSLSAVPKSEDLDERWRNVLRALRKLRSAVRIREEIDEEEWTEERPKEERRKATLTLEGEEGPEEMEIEEATPGEIEKVLGV